MTMTMMWRGKHRDVHLRRCWWEEDGEAMSGTTRPPLLRAWSSPHQWVSIASMWWLCLLCSTVSTVCLCYFVSPSQSVCTFSLSHAFVLSFVIILFTICLYFILIITFCPNAINVCETVQVRWVFLWKALVTLSPWSSQPLLTSSKVSPPTPLTIISSNIIENVVSRCPPSFPTESGRLSMADTCR